MAEKFDVITVGAGPSGCVAAYLLAKEGLDVLVIERGEYPGAKNVSGAVLYRKALDDILPSFWDNAPIERYITRQVVTFLSKRSSVSLDFKDLDYAQTPYNAFTVLRGRFDQWLAKKAEESGALIMNDTLVEDLLWENGKVVGVRAGKEEGDVLADVVIIADGANSLLAEKAKLRRPLSPENMALGVKELLKLPKEVIERRFNLVGNEGVAYTFVGEATQGLEGGAFLYTNEDSLSIGVVCTLSGLIREKKEPASLIEFFKADPMIKGWLDGAILKEYSAHLIPEGGIHMMPKLLSGGILIIGDAAGFTLNTGLTLRGMDFAIASGVMAAKTVMKAKEKGDFSESSLSAYQGFLEDSFVLKDLRTYRNAPNLLRKNSIYTIYPKMICDLAKRVYTVDEKPKKKLLKLVLDEVKEKMTIRQFLKDLFDGGRSI